MINKKNLIITSIVACMTVIPACASSLVQMDINKASDSAVDVTFYTTGTASNPMVTRKSGTKYVVLMPNVAGSNAGTPDLSAVKDIITNVDIKNVDDGMSGYTKVTFVTTKPINIKTHVQKAKNVTQEEKEARAVIAKVKTSPKDIAPPETAKVAKTVVKASAETKAVSTPAENKKVVNTTPKQEKVKNTEVVKKEVAPTPKQETKPVVKQTVEDVVPTKQVVEDVVPTKQAIETEFESKSVDKIAQSAERMAKPIPKKSKSHSGITFVILPLLALYLFARFIKNAIQHSEFLKQSFKEHLNEKPAKQSNYENIINAKELSWQEKYKKFVEESKEDYKPDNVKPQEMKYFEEIQNIEETQNVEETQNIEEAQNIEEVTNSEEVKEEIFENRYSFIKKPVLTEVDKKRLELENTLEKTPQIYQNQEIDISQEPSSIVHSEDESIQKDISLVKFKAFATPVSLNSSSRSKVKKTLTKLAPAKDTKFTELKDSVLNASTRKFRGGNLSVSDLMKKGDKYLKNNSKNSVGSSYLMSSLEEYVALLDKEQAKRTPESDLSGKVAASLSQVKPSMKLNKHVSKQNASNPIESKYDTTNYMNGLVVKHSYNIDENRGFYLVALDGSTALVGRINEEISVIKKFDNDVDDLQIRLDSKNTYMVKAGDFKSLISVEADKMGVLIEL